MTAAERKVQLRRSLRAVQAALPAEYLQESDRAVEAAILASAPWNQAATLFVYYGIGREVDTRGLIEKALAAGKRVALPKCEAAGHMTAHCIESLEALTPGAFGIPEPQGGPILLPEEAELALVPGLAYDRSGFRLGQGGGYYDRWLSGFSGLALGLCRDRLVQGALPRERHDRRVDAVVTETGLFWAK